MTTYTQARELVRTELDAMEAAGGEPLRLTPGGLRDAEGYVFAIWPLDWDEDDAPLGMADALVSNTGVVTFAPTVAFISRLDGMERVTKDEPQPPIPVVEVLTPES